MFSILDGQVELTFRGQRLVARAGETVNVPANAPYGFDNRSDQPARLLCVCAPPGQEQFFTAVGTPLPPDQNRLRRSMSTIRPRS
jgi:mannose-6-phosphate isomerase-like protein (cupin superfamily)